MLKSTLCSLNIIFISNNLEGKKNLTHSEEEKKIAGLF